MSEIIFCELCGRELEMPFDEHHVVPKSKGGSETVLLHRICHSKIHSVFTLTELRNHYFEFDKIKEHPEIQKFIIWINKKPPSFYKRTRSLKK